MHYAFLIWIYCIGICILYVSRNVSWGAQHSAHCNSECDRVSAPRATLGISKRHFATRGINKPLSYSRLRLCKWDKITRSDDETRTVTQLLLCYWLQENVVTHIRTRPCKVLRNIWHSTRVIGNTWTASQWHHSVADLFNNWNYIYIYIYIYYFLCFADRESLHIRVNKANLMQNLF
jgi:hypothetical protein